MYRASHFTAPQISDQAPKHRTLLSDIWWRHFPASTANKFRVSLGLSALNRQMLTYSERESFEQNELVPVKHIRCCHDNTVL